MIFSTSAATSWEAWQDTCTGGVSTCQIWTSWTDDNTTTQVTGATYTNEIWALWTALSYKSRATMPTRGELERTARELERGFAAAHAARVEADRKAAAERAEAEKRARELLERELDEAQKKTLYNSLFFLVKSKSGKLYKVKRGTTHNIIMVHPVTMEELYELCVTVGGDIPVYDVMLAQKLWLEHMEEEALKVANIWDIKRNRARLTKNEQEALLRAA